MNTIIVGIGELGATNTPGTALKTLALGSCVALLMLDPQTRTVGMCHVVLPDSSINGQRARENPGYFADTAVPALLEKIRHFGYRGKGNGLIVKLVGGAKVMDPNNTFNIGKRNVLAIKKKLWAMGMGVIAEDVGGNISRTVTVDVDTGQVLISSAGRRDWSV